jgi:cell division initiation protein
MTGGRGQTTGAGVRKMDERLRGAAGAAPGGERACRTGPEPVRPQLKGVAVRISPLDIRKQTFKTRMRGVDAEEVRIFLELVASEFESVLQENAMMAEKIRYQDERLAEYRDLEKSMRNSLVTAERIASESRETSEREANRIVQEAHMRAERILEDARERLQVLIREIELLKGKKEVYARRFWTLIEGQVGVLQEHMQDMGEVDQLRSKVEQIIARDVREEADGAGPETEGEIGPGDPEWSDEADSIGSPISGGPARESDGGGRPAPHRQGTLPLEEERPNAPEGREGAPENERRGSSPFQERREGVFEIRAAEGPDGELRRKPASGDRP